MITSNKRKKIEIIVEGTFVTQILEFLESLKGVGYTTLPTLSGSGNSGWRGESDVIEVFDNVMIVILTTEEMAQQILDKLNGIMARAPGIVTLSDVEVIYGDVF